MSAKQLSAAIEHVASALGKTKEEIAAKLIAKDGWTWHLVEAAYAR